MLLIGLEPLRLRAIAPALGGVEPLSLGTRIPASLSYQITTVHSRLPISPSSHLKEPTYSHEPAGYNTSILL